MILIIIKYLLSRTLDQHFFVYQHGFHNFFSWMQFLRRLGTNHRNLENGWMKWNCVFLSGVQLNSLTIVEIGMYVFFICRQIHQQTRRTTRLFVSSMFEWNETEFRLKSRFISLTGIHSKHTSSNSINGPAPSGNISSATRFGFIIWSMMATILLSKQWKRALVCPTEMFLGLAKHSERTTMIWLTSKCQTKYTSAYFFQWRTKAKQFRQWLLSNSSEAHRNCTAHIIEMGTSGRSHRSMHINQFYQIVEILAIPHCLSTRWK